ncbi:oxidoreductase [Mytilinidion resinicola]|uniref:Oxidoreductase n=1 Tax=Mytilinidion resinicola TaxID=574789 RepID=A0A6A6Y188_9PEZI|nr:oxidoreductase [Mytilinidion resinicola]KAF2801774.1 oxidoreductase [Mytilinidion resinicola]
MASLVSAKKPLRVALIGLSSSATTSWASAAHLPALKTPAGLSRFTIVALCNSSVAAAQTAIKAYDLAPTTKAYGSPEDLANDPDIDLVICNTRVDKHYETVLPSIKAGKDAYIEWPIASNKAHIDELAKLVKAKGSRVAVGLQGRLAPPVLKLKEIIETGELGKVLSSEIQEYGGTNSREFLPPGLQYFAKREIGGNPITIGFGHIVDLVQSVLGDLVPGSVAARLQLQRPDVRIRDPKIGEIVETIRSDVPDLISLHGALPTSPRTQPSATLSFFFRRGAPFPGDPALTWTITCQLGAIRLVAPSGTSLGAGGYDEPVRIHIHKFDKDVVDEVPWEWDELQEEVPIMGRSVLRHLFNFADGLEEGKGWVGIEAAAKRADQIEGWLKDARF